MKISMEINYNEGYQLARKNYKRIIKSAEHASFIKNYGLACALNILACEEMIKSFYFHIKVLNPIIRIQNFKDIFRDHKVKHKELKNLLESSVKGIDSLEFTILEDKEQFLNTIPENRKEEFEKEYIDIERVKRRTEKIKKSKVSIDDIFLWLDNASHEKNLGLYVGINNKIWQSPQTFKKEQFLRELKYLKLLKKYLDNSVDITKFMAELKLREPLQ